MSDLVSDFVADVRAGYQRLKPALACLGADPHDGDARGAVFRFVHTVHGNAGFLSFERFGRLASAAEEALAQMRDGRISDEADCIATVIALVERIEALAEAVEAGVGIPVQEDAAIMARLGIEIPAPRMISLSSDDKPEEKPGSIRLSVAQYEQLALCVEAVAAAHRNLLGLVSDRNDPQLAIACATISDQIASLDDAVMLAQLLPVDKLFVALDRIVEQTADALGKQVRLNINAADQMIDREIVEGFRDPLLHLVRNALDHGFEQPEARAAIGKDPVGTLSLTVIADDQAVTLCVEDDGRGVDRQRLVQCAAARNVREIGDPDTLSNDQLAVLMATPGVTAAREFSALSGRGIGLDAVQAGVMRLGGEMAFEDFPGLGTRFTLRLPVRRKIARRLDAA